MSIHTISFSLPDVSLASDVDDAFRLALSRANGIASEPGWHVTEDHIKQNGIDECGNWYTMAITGPVDASERLRGFMGNETLRILAERRIFKEGAPGYGWS